MTLDNYTLLDEQFLLAGCCADDELDLKDSIALLRYTVQLEDTLPVILES